MRDVTESERFFDLVERRVHESEKDRVCPFQAGLRRLCVTLIERRVVVCLENSLEPLSLWIELERPGEEQPADLPALQLGPDTHARNEGFAVGVAGIPVP